MKKIYKLILCLNILLFSNQINNNNFQVVRFIEIGLFYFCVFNGVEVIKESVRDGNIEGVLKQIIPVLGFVVKNILDRQ